MPDSDVDVNRQHEFNFQQTQFQATNVLNQYQANQSSVSVNYPSDFDSLWPWSVNDNTLNQHHTRYAQIYDPPDPASQPFVRPLSHTLTRSQSLDKIRIRKHDEMAQMFGLEGDLTMPYIPSDYSPILMTPSGGAQKLFGHASSGMPPFNPLPDMYYTWGA
jgi:hypothetical protein